MRWAFTALAVLALAASISAQGNLEKLVATERAFAALAAEKGTKAAFLENIASDGVLFLPDKVNGRTYWNARGESTGLLSWAPNFADISSNGIMGYTTGNWEYRTKGKGDEPSGFGEFVTIWLRQPSGQYKFVVDIGVAHPRPVRYSEALEDPAARSAANGKTPASAADSANGFYQMVTAQGPVRAYSVYADANVRFFRENEMPGKGKSDLIKRVKKDKGKLMIPKRSVFFETADLAYVTNTYTLTGADGRVEKGNFMQVWKWQDEKWKIVLDIFKPVPAKGN
jgi:hypothetical protein